ncbi:MAG: rhomboid family intramembrane serine protease [Armatimonadia bacterium]|nr:rhomboid family intramembrane serine protease [Armatimonadia bacterium]
MSLRARRTAVLLFPIGTERQRSGFPWATVALIVANTFVFFFLQTGPESANFSLVYGRFEWWMPLTYMFAHGGFLHLAGNMLFLWVFGPHAEDALGRGRFMLVYFSAGFASAALHVLASITLYPDDLGIGLVGASGAIMGVVALFVLRFHGVRVRFFFWWILPYVFYVRALWVGIAFLGWDLLSALMMGGDGAMGGVAHWAHIGGFAAGATWAWALKLTREGTHEIKHDEARDLIAAGAWLAAARKLEERIAERPGDRDLHAEAAACYEMVAGKHEDAARHWNEHLRLLLLGRGRSEAVELFGRLTDRFDPADFDPAVLMRLGAACEGTGHEEMALPALMAVMQAHPDSEQAPDAALRAAGLLSRHDNAARSREILKSIEERWPDSEAALAAATRLRKMR